MHWLALPTRRAVSVFIGTTVGVGVFAVPYTIAQSGIRWGIWHIAVLSSLMLVMYLSFAELTLRTNAHARLVGYASRYWGLPGRTIAAAVGVAGMVGLFLAYAMIAGTFAHTVFHTWLPWTVAQFVLAVCVAVAFALLVRVQLGEETELILSALLFIALTLVLIVGAQRIDPENLRAGGGTAAFLPYGAVLFALGSGSAIAEVRDVLRGREQSLPWTVLIGVLFVAVLISAFTIVVLGVSGAATSEEAIIGLEATLGRGVVTLSAAFGLLAIGSSLITLATTIREVLSEDVRVPWPFPAFVTVAVPVAILILVQPSLATVVQLVGALFVGAEAIMVLLLVLAARKRGDRKPEFTLRTPAVLHWALALLLVCGIVVTLSELT